MSARRSSRAPTRAVYESACSKSVVSSMSIRETAMLDWPKSSQARANVALYMAYIQSSWIGRHYQDTSALSQVKSRDIISLLWPVPCWTSKSFQVFISRSLRPTLCNQALRKPVVEHSYHIWYRVTTKCSMLCKSSDSLQAGTGLGLITRSYVGVD